MRRNWNHCALLAGMSTGAATMENSVEVPQKLKIELPYCTAILLPGIHAKKWNQHIEKESAPPHSLQHHTVESTWESTNGCVKKMWYIHTMNYYSVFQKKILCKEYINGPWRHCAKISQSRKSKYLQEASTSNSEADSRKLGARRWGWKEIGNRSTGQSFNYRKSAV